MIITGFTPLNTQNCILNESRIDLWQFSLQQELHTAQHILNDEERARGDRFYFSQHKRRFTTTRAMLRIILSRYLNTAPERLEFTYGNHGKPAVVNLQKLQFNISHSGDTALIAIGKTYPMGVDIEQYSGRPYEGIAQNLFSEEEIAKFQQIPAAMKTAIFFHIWSQKEAFIKASGLGLAYPTKEFSVPVSMPTKQLIDDPLHNMTWQLRSFMPQIAFSGALCYHPLVREVRHGIIQVQQNASLQF